MRVGAGGRVQGTGRRDSDECVVAEEVACMRVGAGGRVQGTGRRDSDECVVAQEVAWMRVGGRRARGTGGPVFDGRGHGG